MPHLVVSESLQLDRHNAHSLKEAPAAPHLATAQQQLMNHSILIYLQAGQTCLSPVTSSHGDHQMVEYKAEQLSRPEVGTCIHIRELTGALSSINEFTR